MPRSTVLDQFHLSLTDRTRLELIAASRSESVSRVLRASVLLAYHSGSSIAAISRNTGIDRPRSAGQYTSRFRLVLWLRLMTCRGRVGHGR